MKESTKTPAPTEVELKLALPSGQSDALCHHPLLAATPPHQQQLANTYFDTPHRRLGRRTGGGAPSHH